MNARRRTLRVLNPFVLLLSCVCSWKWFTNLGRQFKYIFFINNIQIIYENFVQKSSSWSLSIWNREFDINLKEDFEKSHQLPDLRSSQAHPQAAAWAHHRCLWKMLISDDN